MREVPEPETENGDETEAETENGDETETENGDENGGEEVVA